MRATFQFGTFEFDAEARELRRNGRAVALEPQPARALALLLARAGEVVSRDELKDEIWGSDTHVDFDRGLAYCVSQVRAVLGDSGDNPRFVQTLPKKGYRFIAPVRAGATGAMGVVPQVPSGATGAMGASRRLLIGAATVVVLAAAGMWWSAGGTVQASRAVVAVSVFDNETGLPEHDRLVAGLADLVVMRLTEVSPDRLAVIGNAAILRQPRNIRNLEAIKASVRADYVVLGQLQKADTGLRFVTHLIRLSDQTHLKANRIAMPDANVSGLEGAVVAEFERAIREHVLGPQS